LFSNIIVSVCSGTSVLRIAESSDGIRDAVKFRDETGVIIRKEKLLGKASLSTFSCGIYSDFHFLELWHFCMYLL